VKTLSPPIAPVKPKTGTRDRILALLRAARGSWVPAPALSKIALAYTRNILELRRAGHIIENRVEQHGAERHGFYRLLERDPETSAAVEFWQGAPAPERPPERQQPLIEPAKAAPTGWRDPESDRRRA